jgi:hypothetical protein
MRYFRSSASTSASRSASFFPNLFLLLAQLSFPRALQKKRSYFFFLTLIILQKNTSVDLAGHQKKKSKGKIFTRGLTIPDISIRSLFIFSKLPTIQLS